MFGKGNTEKEAQPRTQKKGLRATKTKLCLSFRILWAVSKESLGKSGLSYKKNVFSHIAMCPKKWQS